ncbi:IS200/IS605 family transposase [Fervidobacterium thailandense]|uniref:Transposase n=1 Tax=Fervidobacterium thailandense TaxID=1008305 RepID=A0A1E3G158_9BACT|nr:IS200/IS605 family transposase [Fervidobacterium thailandense]ODN29984.1 transposase [Fervidobacterium thailandense]
MVAIKSSRHAKYQIAYHFVWIPKYWKQLLNGNVKTELCSIINEIAQQFGFEILALEVMPDHVHLFLSAPPKYSPAEIIKIVKGTTARKLRAKFPTLRNSKHLWTDSYFIATHGNVSAETIRRYIDECQNL